ncbi:M20/M25/M40 family metallo-hydrolase [Salisediminibacterium beveridgei]|uniref:M20/M25/M40 family metallo-hydrolase n=1 Tax=Salisediminibacterium beveridgei TaxID=632773 RepID=UPI000A737B41|nr:M20/M25/M40 family metallo-hydrolase [Salisediminibacterium beveridgei]
MSRIWSTAQQLEELTYELVGWNSVTGTSAETEFSYRLKNLMERVPYFKDHPELLTLHPAETGRQSLTALYRCKDTSVMDTVVLISHFDTVNMDDYGEFEPLALDPVALTNKFKQEAEQEQGQLKKDILSDEYIFGRGIMDMKSGLAQHIQLLDEAIHERLPINLLLITVHDEESDSEGIRTVVPMLKKFAVEYQLNFRLFLNAEPSFPMFEQDDVQYIYSGSMGKLMPAVVVRGKGTHAGDSQRALSAPYILSFITQKWSGTKNSLIHTKVKPHHFQPRYPAGI